MRKNSFLNIAAALWMGVVAAVGLSACSSEDNLSINPQPAQNEVHTYHVCIPASFGDDAQTRAVTPGTDAVSGKPNLVGQFKTTENVVVHNMTTGEDANIGSWTYLHPDADNATTANLTGDLSFSSSIAEGQTLRLIYNSSDKYFTYSEWNADPAQIVSEPGTLAGLSNYDFAVADVTISSISGSGPYTYTLTTSPANFENLQSMFKFTFTGLPTGVGVQMLSVSSENLYISTSHSPVNGYEQYYAPVYISLDDAARAANGAGVVYAAIRFRVTDEDNITFTVTGTDGNTYAATKHTTGFSNGKYYTATIALTKLTVDLAAINSDYTAQDGEILTGTLAGNYKISIADGATVTLKDVNITNITNSYSHNWAGITCLGDAVVILEGTNVVYSGYEDCSGFIGASGKTLTIKGNGSLTTQPTGSSRAGAGILIGENGHIVIQGGTIVTNGYDGCAGIQISGTGTVTITGGHITANGGPRAAGIGAGNTGTCGAINISGGTIIARGGEYAAAIGGGNWSVHGDITITSGVTSVSATKGSQSVHSIGNGYNPKSGCGSVTIGGVEGAISDSPYTYQP